MVVNTARGLGIGKLTTPTACGTTRHLFRAAWVRPSREATAGAHSIRSDPGGTRTSQVFYERNRDLLEVRRVLAPTCSWHDTTVARC
jgi:hypothetical protein